MRCIFHCFHFQQVFKTPFSPATIVHNIISPHCSQQMAIGNSNCMFFDQISFSSLERFNISTIPVTYFLSTILCKPIYTCQSSITSSKLRSYANHFIIATWTCLSPLCLWNSGLHVIKDIRKFSNFQQQYCNTMEWLELVVVMLFSPLPLNNEFTAHTVNPHLIVIDAGSE